jgi:hypothetical protein
MVRWTSKRSLMATSCTMRRARIGPTVVVSFRYCVMAPKKLQALVERPEP